MGRKKELNLDQQALPIFDMPSPWPEKYSEGLENLHGERTLGFDIETSSLSPYRENVYILSCAFSKGNGETQGAIINHQGKTIKESDRAELERVLTDPNIVLAGHNIKFDVNWIKVKLGIDVKCILFDTLYAQYLIDENRTNNSLESLAEIYEDLIDYKKGINRNKLIQHTKDDLLIYNCKDADASRRLVDYYVPRLKAQKLMPLYTIGMRVLPILSDVEVRGVYLDRAWAMKEQEQIFRSMVDLAVGMRDIVKVSFDANSPAQMAHVLYDVLKFPCQKMTERGKPSTDEEALGYLYDHIVTSDQQNFLEKAVSFRERSTLISKYYKPIPDWIKFDGRVHTIYYMGKTYGEERGGTVTGRLSSGNPNMQNIPRDRAVRGMFAATPGYTLLDMDFSQLELRVAAFLAQEPVMMQAFLDGRDIHTAVMADLQKIPYDELKERLKTDVKLQNERVAIKRINFGILYGMDSAKLQRLLKIELKIDFPIELCKDIIREWLGKYTRIVKMMDNLKAQAVGYGWVGMPLGQRRRLPDASFATGLGRRALRQAINFPVQSMASWICFLGMINIDQYFKDTPEIDGHIILQVHDSICSEIRTDMLTEKVISQIRSKLEVDVIEFLWEYFSLRFNVPLTVSCKTGERWQ